MPTRLLALGDSFGAGAPARGAARLRAPVLFAAAKGDSVLPADAKPGSAHGVNLLDTATESVVLRFIRANT